jgi:2-polyprenyl-3-methyl-5-hydroxy-6-metoxy-1,4-benzoquinol methylase
MDEYVAANRRLWDEWTGVNARSSFYDVEGFKAGGVRLRDWEIAEVGDVAGKELLHLQCHFGLDTLSWARLGAHVTGVDFSEAGIAEARALTKELGMTARFVCSELSDLPRHLNGQFDVVYTTCGVLGWLADLKRWAKVPAYYMRPGGVLYVTEIHPIAQVWDDSDDIRPGELRLRYPYWEQREPIATPVQGSYTDRGAHVDEPAEYTWQHSLGEIVTAVAEAGLHIEFLHEFPFVVWPVPFLEEQADRTWRLPGELSDRLPLFFSLRAAKPGR